MESEATFFEVECQNHWAQYGGCYHEQRWSIPHAVAVWGSLERIRRLRFVCTHCGSRRFELNWRFHCNQGGHAIWPGIELHERLTLYRWRYMQAQSWRDQALERMRHTVRRHSPAWS